MKAFTAFAALFAATVLIVPTVTQAATMADQARACAAR